jgi:hypothetical protein
MRSVAIALVLLPLAGCAGPWVRAKDQFVDGRYSDAKQTLLSLEAESRGWNDAERAEYALYRGLTHAALGDREPSAVWLREARAIEDAHPGSLSHDAAQRLKVGIESTDP